jgi:hypothetical protein
LKTIADTPTCSALSPADLDRDLRVRGREASARAVAELAKELERPIGNDRTLTDATRFVDARVDLAREEAKT